MVEVLRMAGCIFFWHFDEMAAILEPDTVSRNASFSSTQATKNSSTVHEALKRPTRSLFWTRASFLATSLGLHLAHPSKLEGHLDQWGSHLLEELQLLENCVTELTNYKTPMMGLIQQMKYLQSQLHLHQHWVKSITKCAMELCVRRNSAVHPLEFSDLSGTSDLSHLIAQRM